MAMPTQLFQQQQPQGGLLTPNIAALLGLAGGLLGNRDQRLGPGLGQGLLAGMGAHEAATRTQMMDRRGQLEEQQLAAQQAERQRMEQQRAQMEAQRAQLRGTLAPDQQQLFDMDPEGFSKALINQRMPAPMKPELIGGETGGYKWFDPNTMQAKTVVPGIGWAPPAPPAPDRTLVEVYDPNSPTGTLMVPRDQAAGRPGKPSASMMQITGWDDKGLPLIEVGGRSDPKATSTPLTRTVATDVQKDVIALQDQAARVSRTAALWRPEFQTLGPRFGAAVTAGKEKLGIPSDPAEAKSLEDFTYARQAAATDFNAMVKEQAGTAMTAAEAQRVQQQMPNPGTGLLDGDSPSQFKAKLDGRAKELKLALARKTYLLQRGIKHDFAKGDTGGIAIDDMPKIIDKRGEEIEADLKAKGMPAADAERQATMQVKQEFGL